MWEAATPSPARSTASSTNTRLLTGPRQAAQRNPSVFRYGHCWHCEPGFGREDDTCDALKTLGELASEMSDKEEDTLQSEEVRSPASHRLVPVRLMARPPSWQAGDDPKLVRRAARYYLYRKWVWETHSYLGRYNRVRVPPCVVEHIRNRFREPDCECPMNGELFRCTRHGYTGHREAELPADDAE